MMLHGLDRVLSLSCYFDAIIVDVTGAMMCPYGVPA